MTNPVAGEITLGRRLRREWLGVGFAPPLSVTAPVALLVLGLTAFSAQLALQDFWLALVSGREIAEHGLPSVDHLSVLASGHRWVDQQWLGQIFLYAIARIGGVGAAAAVCMFAGAAALSIAGLTAHRRGASPLAILAFLVMCVAAAPWGVQFRTQALALPLFSLTLWLLVRDRDAERTSTLWVVPILCLWANLHGSVVLGAALVATYGLQALVRGARGAAGLRAVTCLALSPLTLLASPYALSLPGYYRMMLVDPPFGRQIQEWQRTTPSGLTAVFFTLVAIVIVVLVMGRKRLGLFEALVLALTLASGLDAIRGIVWFALASAALLPPIATRRPWATRLEGRAAEVLAWVAVGASFLAVAWLGARPATAFSSRFPRTLLPVVSAKTAHGNVRVFADDSSADWLLWELPALRGRVAYDVRFELLTRSQFKQLIGWNRRTRGWRSEVSGYSLVVGNPKHVDRLVAQGDWRRLVPASRTPPHIGLAERVPRQTNDAK